MTKFVLYRRLSKEDKARNQHGFESQRQDIFRYLLNNEYDYEILGDFKEFISGGADNKPELEKALEICKEEGATLLIAKLDRFSRRVSQIANLMESNINLKVAMMPRASTFELHIYASLAQQEREMIQDRVTRGLAVVKQEAPEKLAKGKDSQWHKTFQANRANHAKTKRKEASRQRMQPVVTLVTDMISFSNNSLTLDAIADKLNERNITTATGKPWKKQNVSGFIKMYNIKR
jgi:DNA invertase Pin-like site-specific DNA recombinase